MATSSGAAQGAPVSRERITNCLRSASVWVEELPRYADRQQRRADFWAILAGILAALTSLAIFPVLDESATAPAKVAVSTVALAAAICALVPRVKNYGELAGQARELSSRYGGIVGDLLDLSVAGQIDQEQARLVVNEFESIKERKDALRDLPDRARIEIERAEMEEKVAAARAKAAAAAKASHARGRPQDVTE
jgi:hypothetical protein